MEGQSPMQSYTLSPQAWPDLSHSQTNDSLPPAYLQNVAEPTCPHKTDGD